MVAIFNKLYMYLVSCCKISTRETIRSGMIRRENATIKKRNVYNVNTFVFYFILTFMRMLIFHLNKQINKIISRWVSIFSVLNRDFPKNKEVEI